MAVIFGLQVVDRSFGPVLLLHVTELGYSEREAAVLVGVLFSVLAVCAALGNQLAAAFLKRSRRVRSSSGRCSWLRERWGRSPWRKAPG